MRMATASWMENELIRYVTSNVPRATGDKQHPTDISPGNVDIKLSDTRSRESRWRTGG